MLRNGISGVDAPRAPFPPCVKTRRWLQSKWRPKIASEADFGIDTRKSKAVTLPNILDELPSQFRESTTTF